MAHQHDDGHVCDHDHDAHEHHDDGGHEGHDHHDHHGHGHHHHEVSADADFRKLSFVVGLLGVFMLVEVTSGFIAQSMALISDAGHMLADAGALVFSMLAIKLAMRPAKGAMTYGLKRFGIISGLTNGLLIIGGAIVIVAESLRRLTAPPEVEGHLMLAIALVGVVVNIVATYVMHKANREDINIRSSYQHMLTDLFAFVGTAVAAGIILLTGFNQADAIMSLVVAGLMLRAGIPILLEAVRVLLQIAPSELYDPIHEAIESHEDVATLEELHVWELASKEFVVTAHIVVADSIDALRDNQVCQALCEMLRRRFSVTHATIQTRYTNEPIQVQVLHNH